MIELFTMVHNEAFILPRMVAFYRSRIPDIIINVYDNHSTDDTIEIARSLGCNVYDISSEGLVNDQVLIDFKNNIWNESKADWVIIVDADEWVDFKPMRSEADWFKCEGYNMVSPDLGMRYHMEDKVCVFKPSIKHVRYNIGAHTANPDGTPGDWNPRLYHMKYAFGPDLVIEKYRDNASRMSPVNELHGWSFHYKFPEDKIREEYNQTVAQSRHIDNIHSSGI